MPDVDDRVCGIARGEGPPLRLTLIRGDKARTSSRCATWTDEQLVFAVRDTRDTAFAELFRRHSASVGAVARMILGSSNSGCDDVVAEVFEALWSEPEKFDPLRGSLLGFLRLRARGRSIDLLRSESCRLRREQNDDTGARLPSAIDARLIAGELGASLRQVVSQLPEAERTVIELAYFAGMTYRAVARTLELPEGTVKSRIRSGLQHLRVQVGTVE